MIKVGDVYESDVAVYTIVRETRCKWWVKRVNKPNHQSANMEFPVCGYWKRCFDVSRLTLKGVVGDK